jgi:hypothetical protein
MVDRVKPLGIESSSTGGSEDEQIPTEMNPLEDYVAVKGIAFENSDDFRLEKFKRVILESFPLTTQLVTYLGNGDVDYVEYFNSATQINANRIAKITIGYTSGDPTSETAIIYDTDGTTTSRTITSTFSYTGSDVTGISRVET